MLDDIDTTPPDPVRRRIRDAYLADEAATVRALIDQAALSSAERERIGARATEIVEHIRGAGQHLNLMESFLGEYGLTNQEGIALMCLAEAMLRVPDAHTLDALIQDKIGAANWRRHVGRSASLFVNASSWGLMLAGVLVHETDQVLTGQIKAAVRRLGEPVIREAVRRAMGLLGDHFVLGSSIQQALKRSEPWHRRGYRFSYDMLGEAAKTAADAKRYFLSYAKAIAAIGEAATAATVAENPGISIKLSALHPRYEVAKRGRVVADLAGQLKALALPARAANMGLNVDAEEADRLELSLDVIEAVLGDDALADWDGFGVVVQAYQKRAPAVIDWLIDLARRRGRRVMVRLVKGAYWDSEIKHFQERGLAGYPVFTRKPATDIAFIACAKQLLGQRDLLYPQFATHNAHTVAAVLELAGGDTGGFEFQRLQGMGEALHGWIVDQTAVASRIYAPVGVHTDLLSYLVRRLLENGANSSFVNQIVNPALPVAEIVADPVTEIRAKATIPHDRIPLPPDLYQPERANSRGVDLAAPAALAALKAALEPFATATWRAADPAGAEQEIRNPADHGDLVGHGAEATAETVRTAVDRAAAAAPAWRHEPASSRAEVLRRVADLYEENQAELMAICVREAGKTLPDAVAELREAVDFCRFYAAEAERLAPEAQGPGPFVCISPWNFPLAIFTGQVAAALAAGNPVLAKPAEQTPLIAARAVALMHQAGVPADVLHLVPGRGETVGAALVADPRVAGVVFTGSTEVAQTINRTLRTRGNAAATFIAETGGINAMIVDSTALPEQAVDDIVTSAFQSAGQRCSALRLLFLQTDIADGVLAMLAGAMATLEVGDPGLLATDVGPVIDRAAQGQIERHVTALKSRARLIHEVALGPGTEAGTFIAPVAFEIETPDQLDREVFGPVLHVCRFAGRDLDLVVDAINAKGYGLTLGLHTRINTSVERVCRRARVGNVYVNRNQIGAVVGVQPFGGEGLSGTGPKAGGPAYVEAFTRRAAVPTPGAGAAPPQIPAGGIADEIALLPRRHYRDWDQRADRAAILERLARAVDSAHAAEITAAARWAEACFGQPEVLPGPTGEQNEIALHAKGVFLCLGDLAADETPAMVQAAWALAAGNGVVARFGEACRELFLAAGVPAPVVQAVPATAEIGARLIQSPRIAGIAVEGTAVAPIRRLAALREGPIVPVVTASDRHFRYAVERTVSIDTTAAGGNASLLTLAG